MYAAPMDKGTAFKKIVYLTNGLFRQENVIIFIAKID